MQTKKRCKDVYKRSNNTNSVACAGEKWPQCSGLTRALTPSCWCSRVIVERGASKNVRVQKAVKCSPLGRTQSVRPWFHSSCGSLHQTCIRLDLTSVKHPWERSSWAPPLPAELLATVGLWGMLSCYIWLDTHVWLPMISSKLMITQQPCLNSGCHRTKQKHMNVRRSLVVKGGDWQDWEEDEREGREERGKRKDRKRE